MGIETFYDLGVVENKSTLHPHDILHHSLLLWFYNVLAPLLPVRLHVLHPPELVSLESDFDGTATLPLPVRRHALHAPSSST
eukprot:11002826-Heterocapsa_arctica.AAC.1